MFVIMNGLNDELVTHSETVAQFRSTSMPAGYCRRLVGKTLRNVCYSRVT